MADKKITDLPTLTTADTNDTLEIVDTSANASKEVTVSGLAAAIASSIPAGSIVPNSLVSGTGTTWSAQSWTPTFTNLSGGTLTNAIYTQIGKNVFYYIYYTFSGANISGGVSFTLPTPTSSLYLYGGGIGHAVGTTTGSGVIYNLGVNYTYGSPPSLYANEITSTYLRGISLSATVPFTWAADSRLTIWGNYQAP